MVPELSVCSSIYRDSATVIASFSVGVAGCVYARVSGHQPLVVVLSGILILVPGSMGVKGVVAILSNDVVSYLTSFALCACGGADFFYLFCCGGHIPRCRYLASLLGSIC